MTIKMNQTTADCGTGWRYDAVLARWQRRLILRYSSLVLIFMPTAKPGGIFASMVMSSLMDREWRQRALSVLSPPHRNG